MKKKVLHIITIFATVLAVQPLLFSATAFAQAYGESSYSGGIYNNARTDIGTDSDQLSNSSQNPSTSIETPTSDQNYGNTSTESDTIATDDESAMGSDNGGSDANDSIREERSDEKSDDLLLRRVSVGAVGAASLLIILTLIARKRRQE